MLHRVINGSVSGPVNSSEYVELQSKANVTGNVYYNALEMQPGAVVQGRLVHQAGGEVRQDRELKPASAE